MKRLSLLFILTYLLVQASLSHAQEAKPKVQLYGGTGLFVSNLVERYKDAGYTDKIRNLSFNIYEENKLKTGFTGGVGLQFLNKRRLSFSPEIMFYTTAHQIHYTRLYGAPWILEKDTFLFNIHQTLLRLPMLARLQLFDNAGVELLGGLCLDVSLAQKLNGYSISFRSEAHPVGIDSVYVDACTYTFTNNNIDNDIYKGVSVSWVAGVRLNRYKNFLLQLQATGSMGDYLLGVNMRQYGFSLTACYKFGKK